MGHRRIISTVLILAGDCAAACLALACAYYLRVLLEGAFAFVPLLHGLSVYLSKWWLFAVIVIVLGYNGGYGMVVSFWDDVLLVFKSLLVAFLLVWMILSLQKEAGEVSRLVLTFGFAFMAVTIPAVRFAVKGIRYKVRGCRGGATLLGAEPSEGEELTAMLDKEWYSGYRISEVIGTELPRTPAWDTCFIPVRNAHEGWLKEIKMKAKHTVLVADISGLSFMNAEVKPLLGGSLSLITSANGLLSAEKLILKRAMDLFVATPLLILSLPLLLCVALAVKLESKGPVFYMHRRCGKDLAEFGMLKFRTMIPNGDHLLERHIRENHNAGADWAARNKVKDDPRVTRVGKILRKTSCDELPQLVNVIMGNMSLVGPRPDTREAIAGFIEEYREIYGLVKPGITGLWQVSGRSDVDYAARVDLDYLYVLNWSPWLDFVILLKTFRAIVSGEGAY